VDPEGGARTSDLHVTPDYTINYPSLHDALLFGVIVATVACLCALLDWLTDDRSE
jgi:hypothetical protein